MGTLTARLRLSKQANLLLIRRVIKTQDTATRAEIASETGISVITIHSLLAETMENGEIESIGHDASSSGRKTERYRFNPDRHYGAVLCTTNGQIHSLLVNVCGEIVEIFSLEVPDGNHELVTTVYLGDPVQHKGIESIGADTPGVVEDSSFWSQNKQNYELSKILLGSSLARRYDVPVTLENDLNATAIGFCRCYAKEFPGENPEDSNMVHLHFEEGCISVGLIAGGRAIRGCSNFTGETGLIPTVDGGALAEYMAEPMDDKQYISFAVQIIFWICGIPNPQYVLLGGSSLRKDCIGLVSDTLTVILPKHMFATVLYSPDAWNDYHDGMAYLTAGKMFDNIQFIKEPPY